MSGEPTTGVLDPGKPGRWLVPPWPADACFSDIVRHFLRHDVQWYNPSTAQLLAYFEAYDAALEGAPADEKEYAFQQSWCEDMRSCVARCARLYRERAC